MKKIIYLLIALIAQSNFLIAQDNKFAQADSKQGQKDTDKSKKDCKKSKKSKSDANKVNMLEIDFNTKKLSINSLESIKEGEYYQIKINHINQNLFKVSLSSIDTFSSKPQQTPTFGNFDLEALTKLISAISPLSTAIAKEEKSNFSNISNKGFSEELPRIKVNGIPEDTISKRIAMEKSDLSKANESIASIKGLIDTLNFKINKFRLNSLRLNNDSIKFNYDSTLMSLEQLRKVITTLKVELQKSQESYDMFSTIYKTEIAKGKTNLSNDTLIKGSYKQILGLLTEVYASVSADKANELLSSIVFIDNNSSNIYTSLPIQFLGEQAKVQISITPRDETYKLQSYNTQVLFPHKIKTYTSVGLSYYASTLHDDAFSSTKTIVNDSTNNYSFKEELGNNLELGLATMLRYGRKCDNNNFGTHFSVGAGISLSNKVKPRFLVGGGFSVGKKHMLAVDLGGIVGYVDRLSSTIDLNKTDYPEKPETITVSKVGFGGFLSVGYIYQF